MKYAPRLNCSGKTTIVLKTAGLIQCFTASCSAKLAKSHEEDVEKSLMPINHLHMYIILSLQALNITNVQPLYAHMFFLFFFSHFAASEEKASSFRCWLCKVSVITRNISCSTTVLIRVHIDAPLTMWKTGFVEIFRPHYFIPDGDIFLLVMTVHLTTSTFFLLL